MATQCQVEVLDLFLKIALESGIGNGFCFIGVLLWRIGVILQEM
jgi:hypothetical protein